MHLALLQQELQYLGSSEQFDDALAKYSEAYADQAERDFKTFQAAIRSGRLSTEPAKSAGFFANDQWSRSPVNTATHEELLFCG